MSKLWLAVMVVVALVLVAGPALAAEGEDGAEKPKRPAGERGGPPRVEVTKEQAKEMKTEIEALEKAIADLQAKAIEVLGDERAGRGFTMQTIFTKMRPEGAERPGGREGGAEHGKKRPTTE
ncbi:MAG: hypothetical protein ISS74_01910 [Planctomycetes bacterium]|nr:hypothetical protein [Planctomycetota bacterium]